MTDAAYGDDDQYDTEAAPLKRETVPRPQAWRIRQAEIARLAADGAHCETRRCRQRVVVVTPPQRDGAVNPAVLYACALTEADELYAVGGAQAIAALAYGTQTIAPVD